MLIREAVSLNIPPPSQRGPVPHAQLWPHRRHVARAGRAVRRARQAGGRPAAVSRVVCETAASILPVRVGWDLTLCGMFLPMWLAMQQAQLMFLINWGTAGPLARRRTSRRGSGPSATWERQAAQDGGFGGGGTSQKLPLQGFHWLCAALLAIVPHHATHRAHFYRRACLSRWARLATRCCRPHAPHVINMHCSCTAGHAGGGGLD